MTVIGFLGLSGLVATLFLGAWLILESGVWLGSFRRRREAGVVASGAATTLLGSLLALLAFMLAFTFGVTANRFEVRRQFVIDEANAISTAFLRVDLLESPAAERLRDYLREYADLRVAAAGTEPEAAAASISRSEQLHGLMWAQLMEAVEIRPVPTNALVLNAFNSLFDLHTERIAAGFRDLGAPVWGALLLLAVLGALAVGYDSGVSAVRPSPVAVLFMIALSVVVLLIADLDAPRSGWLRTDQQAMVDVAQMMREAR